MRSWSPSPVAGLVAGTMYGHIALYPPHWSCLVMPTDDSKRQIVWLCPKHGHSDIESEVRKTVRFRVYVNSQQRNLIRPYRAVSSSWELPRDAYR